ncbi:MAG TPA: hypothetical protein VKX16_15895 [Chloroflexota bacterium]|nr:hypothetical protein [Chloroflexota bacterium]
MERRARFALVALVLSLGICSLFAPMVGNARAAARARKPHPCVFDHMMLKSRAHTCRPRARHYPAAVTTAVERAIYDGALIFGIPYDVLYKIAVCESGLDPHAAYLGHYGLYQFVPDTFHRGAGQLHAAVGVVARSYWNPLDSAYVAGYLYATGQSRSWSCEKGGQLPPGAGQY